MCVFNLSIVLCILCITYSCVVRVYVKDAAALALASMFPLVMLQVAATRFSFVVLKPDDIR